MNDESGYVDMYSTVAINTVATGNTIVAASGTSAWVPWVHTSNTSEPVWRVSGSTSPSDVSYDPYVLRTNELQVGDTVYFRPQPDPNGVSVVDGTVYQDGVAVGTGFVPAKELKIQDAPKDWLSHLPKA